MSADPPFSGSADSGSPVEDSPPAEDVYNTAARPEPAMVEEDDPTLLDQSSRALEAASLEPDPGPQSDTPLPSTLSADAVDISGDMTVGPADSAVMAAAHPEQTGDWEDELSSHRVAVELRRIESDIRAMLEERDLKRKRKLSGTSRWQELEDDILSWRFGGRFDESSVRQLQALITRRHYLFNRLRFLASTRPTWNS